MNSANEDEKLIAAAPDKIPEEIVAAAVRAGFDAAPGLGTYHTRQPTVDAFTRAALGVVADEKAFIQAFARVHMGLIKAIEAEGYTVHVHIITGEHTLEHKSRDVMKAYIDTLQQRNPADMKKLYEGSFDLAAGPDEHVVICGMCKARLRPGHRNAEDCPVCNRPVILTPTGD